MTTNPMTRRFLLCTAAAAAVFVMSGCDNKETAGTASVSTKQVVIYTNADEEAQSAMRNALDSNGLKGAYIMQSFGTSELGGKLVAEGRNIEADVVTISTYYLESLQNKANLFKNLTFPVKTIEKTPAYYAPILGNMGALFVNTKVLAADNIPAPQSIRDLASPIYKGHISVPDIMGSSTSWLMTQAAIAAEGPENGAKIIQAIEANAGAHLEKSGSAPLKKLRAGEVAVGFGLRHQAVADKKKGLPIDYVDPSEGNFTLHEAAAVVDKGDKTNPNAMKVVQTIIEKSRAEMIKVYPVALYQGETVPAEMRPANARAFPQPLTVELLQEHQKLVKNR